MKYAAFRFADWEVDPSTNSLFREGERRQMEPRAMDVLVALCRRANAIVSSEELLEQCWGTSQQGDNPVHKTIAQLRNLLGDNTRSPVYIETIRKRGYRTIGPVVFDHPKLAENHQGSPFRGLQSFNEEDASVFFGRSAAIAQLLDTVAAQSAGGRMTVVLGPSGSGKTSLVRAGLLPGLLQGRHKSMRALSATAFDLAELGEHPLLTALGGVLLDWQIGDTCVFSGESSVSLGERLAQDFDWVLAELQVAVAAQPQDGNCVALFIDRFETLFAAPHINAAQREAFLRVLDALARSRCVAVVLACRNDFYPHIASDAVLMASKPHGGHFDVLPPTQAEMAQIIRLPAQSAGLRFGIDPQSNARLDDVLCACAGAARDALPLLQHMLHELYRLRTADGELGFDAFHRLGGMEGAIGQRAEEVVGALSEAQRDSLPRLLSMLVTLSDRDEMVTSRRVPWSALNTPAKRELVAALVDARLFVTDLVGDEPGFGVAHEALLRHWPRVTAWIDEHRNALRVRGRLQLAAQRWNSEGRTSDLLLPQGKQLDEALQLLGDESLSLSAGEIALVKASQRRSARGRRIWMGTLAAIVALSLLVASLGLSAMSAKKAAQQRRAEAEGLMGFMLGDFADKLRPIGKLDLLDSVSAKALDYLATPDVDDLSDTALTQRAKALQVLAEVRVARGKPGPALEALAAARAILQRQHALGPNQWEVVKNLGANAFWQGQIHLNQGNWDKAQQAFEQYRDYSDRLYQIAPDNPDAWIEQSYSATNLGQLALKRGDTATAARQFATSIELKERAAKKRPQDRTLAGELANSLSWLGTTKETLGLLDEAIALYGRELALDEQLHNASPNDALWASRMAGALEHRGRLRGLVGQQSAALADLDHAESLLQSAVEREPNQRIWQGNLTKIRLDKLQLRLDRDGSRAVLPALLALEQDMQALMAIDAKKANWARLSAGTEKTIGVALASLGRTAEAGQWLEKSRLRLDSLLQANRSDVWAAADLAHVLLSQAELREGSGGNAAAIALCTSAAALIPAKALQINDYRMLDPWTRAQACLGKDAVASDGIARLTRMGYREYSYLNYLNKHNLKEKQ
jgi:DNA-binding winged helix-turn-helix (wHTH) protein/tetratricopeptide (TPR) repeat protein/ABC-type cobalamin/Fe3+-siderophores transport system ATPase subunit